MHIQEVSLANCLDVTQNVFHLEKNDLDIDGLDHNETLIHYLISYFGNWSLIDFISIMHTISSKWNNLKVSLGVFKK